MEFKVTMGEMEEAVRALYKMKQSLKTLDSALGKLQREIQQQDGKLAKAMNIAYGGHRDTVDRETVAVEKLFTYLSSYMEDFRSIDGEIYPNRPSIINPSYLRNVAKSEEQALHELSYTVFASHAPPRSMFPILDDKPDMKANQTHNKQVLEELDRELKQKIRQLQDSEGHELAKTAKKMEQLLQMEQRHASRIEKDYRNYDRNKTRQIGAGMKVTATSFIAPFFHPVQTVKGLGSLATSFLADPLETTKLVAYQSMLEPYEYGDAYGYTNVVTGVMGVIGVAGGINRLARLKKFGKVAPSKVYIDTKNGKKLYLSKKGHAVKGYKKLITDGSHMKNGKLRANIIYRTGEHHYIYETNSKGVIVHAYADDLQLKIHEGRKPHNPKTPDKQEGDHAGHLVADRFGGSGDLDNLVSQAKKVNLKHYKRLEDAWARAIKEGKKVTVDIKIEYSGDSLRPKGFDINYKINNVKYYDFIKNN